MRYTATIALAVVVMAAATAACWGQGFGYNPWEVTSPESQPTPSWYGSTGLIRTPTALTTPQQQISGFAHEVKLQNKWRTIYGINVGLISGLELSAARVEDILQTQAGPLEFKENVVNFKYEATIGGLFNNPAAPTMCIGAYDVSDRINRVNYVVLSQTLGLTEESVSPLPTMHAHVGFGKSKRNGGPLDGLFGGIDFVAWEHALAQIEYDGENLNGALRYYPATWLSLDAGIVHDELGWGVTLNTAF